MITPEMLAEAIGMVNDRAIIEAKEYRPPSKTCNWVKWGAMVACLAVVFITVFSMLPNFFNQHGITPPDNPNIPPNNPNDVISDHPNDSTSPSISAIHISMSNITFNDLEEVTSASPKWYDPELYDNVVWDKEDIIDYYGKDLTPAYAPNGFVATSGNRVVADKEGNIVLDTVWMGFYHALNEDGSPKLTEDALARKGFSITVSKIGLLNDCIYLLPENEVKSSDVCGTPVTFGYRSMPYGPYDTETSEPSGYYDVYVAEFEYKGIEYQIVAEQMKADEIVKVIASIVCGEEVVVNE